MHIDAPLQRRNEGTLSDQGASQLFLLDLVLVLLRSQRCDSCVMLVEIAFERRVFAPP